MRSFACIVMLVATCATASVAQYIDENACPPEQPCMKPEPPGVRCVGPITNKLMSTPLCGVVPSRVIGVPVPKYGPGKFSCQRVPNATRTACVEHCVFNGCL